MENVRILLLIVLMFMLHGRKISGEGDGVLVQDYYKETCPLAEEIMRRIVENAVVKDPRMAASLLRLHFHDCFLMVTFDPIISLICFIREKMHIFFPQEFLYVDLFWRSGL